MIAKLKWYGYLLVMHTVLASPIGMVRCASAQSRAEYLDWSIKSSKRTFYAGEPVLLTLTIRNGAQEAVDINFGPGGIGAFSIQVRNRAGEIVAKGNKIRRFGFIIFRPTEIPPGEIAHKSIVLNQWCTTLLPPGNYHVICRVEYRLHSETRQQRAGPLHTIDLELDIEVVKTDNSALKKIFDEIASRETRRSLQTREEWLRDRQIAREMLTFAESPLAVPYQVRILRVSRSSWLRKDVINSLVRSGTLEATNGLMRAITENEGCPECIEDIRREIIDAVYRLRETGKSDIISATSEFVAKYERPTLGKSLSTERQR